LSFKSITSRSSKSGSTRWSASSDSSASAKRIGMRDDVLLSAVIWNRVSRSRIFATLLKRRFVREGPFHKVPEIVYHSHHASICDASWADDAQSSAHVSANAVGCGNHRAVLHGRE